MKPLTYLNDAVQAPKAIGPYSQAVACGDLLFLSGQIALDPQTGQLVPGGVERQTEQVLSNLFAVLNQAGLDFTRVVKTTIFLTNLESFQKVNTIYEKFFGQSRPARSTVQVSALPRGAEVEIELVACSA